MFVRGARLCLQSPALRRLSLVTCGQRNAEARSRPLSTRVNNIYTRPTAKQLDITGKPLYSLTLPNCFHTTVSSNGSPTGSSNSKRKEYPAVKAAEIISGRRVRVTWSSGISSNEHEDISEFPLVWLRDNCQCDDCYSHGSVARKYLMDNLLEDSKSSSVEATQNGGLEITWANGHVSPYSKEWLNGRRFEEKQRTEYRDVFQLPKKFWSEDFELSSYDYKSLMEDDEALYGFLCDVEGSAAALVKDMPPQPQAAYHLTERIGRVQATHYGDFSNVEVQDDPENVSYSNYTLNLHNDLPQYINQPGIIFLHMIRQHRGAGGDTTISDGVRAATVMRVHHPEAFKVLTQTKVYFLAKGHDSNYDGRVRRFFKINKEPIIELDATGAIVSTHFNNQGRESHMDLSVDEAERFYDALAIFFDLIKKFSLHVRLQDGEMAVIDNDRCQHGRLGFTGSSERHLVTSYMSWDEALCMRRQLHEKLKGRVI